LPVVALPDAVTGLSVQPMRHCLVAGGPEEFVQYYLMLMKDPALAERVGMAGRELVMQSYTIEAAAQILESELKYALGASVGAV
jgi:hypothetical protein